MNMESIHRLRERIQVGRAQGNSGSRPGARPDQETGGTARSALSLGRLTEGFRGVLLTADRILEVQLQTIIRVVNTYRGRWLGARGLEIETDRQLDTLVMTAIIAMVVGSFVAGELREVIALAIALIAAPLCYLLWVTRTTQARLSFAKAAPRYLEGCVWLTCATGFAAGADHMAPALGLGFVMCTLSYTALHLMLSE